MLLLLTWEEIFLEHIESIKNDERNIVYCFDFIDKFYLVHILSCVHREIPVGKNTCMFFNWFYCHNIMERGWIFFAAYHICDFLFNPSWSGFAGFIEYIKNLYKNYRKGNLSFKSIFVILLYVWLCAIYIGMAQN